MSVESQSERIWRYATRPTPTIRDTMNASLNASNDASRGARGNATADTDVSEDLGSIPFQISLDGLLPSQSPITDGAWIGGDKSGSRILETESQKENLEFPPSSGPQSSLSLTPSDPMSLSRERKTIGPASGNAFQSSHVMQHVTVATSRAEGALRLVNPQNASTAFASGPARQPDERQAVAVATPSKIPNNSPLFRSPSAPPAPSPPPSPPKVSPHKSMPPRVNRYAPRDVRPSSQDSFAEPPVAQDLNQFARSSAILQNTFIRRSETGEIEAIFQRPSDFPSTSSSAPPVGDDTASTSPPENPEAMSASQVIRAAFDPDLSPPHPEPVVLAEDSEHHSQDSARGVDDQENTQSTESYHLPSLDNVLVPTQPSSQHTQEPTQHHVQPTQPVAPPTTSRTSFTSTFGGPSPLPVPPHRRHQMAAILSARQRGRDEVIPETPQSAVPPSARASAPSAKEDTPGKIQSSSRATGTGQHPLRVEPTSAGTHEQMSRRQLERETGAARGGQYAGEFVPDSQESEERHRIDHIETVVAKATGKDLVIPDSQEEHCVEPAGRHSSPEIPLQALHQSRNPGEMSLAPDAILDVPRKRLQPDEKGKAKTLETVPSGSVDIAAGPAQEDVGSMDIDEGQRVDPPTLRTTRKTMTRASGKKRKAPNTGPSTRSKTRATTAEPAKRVASSESPAKRQRKSKPLSSAAVLSSSKGVPVFARRTDKDGDYFPGIVLTTMASRTSTVFCVRFEDGFEDDVDVTNMRRFRLENSDVVHVKWPAKHKDCVAEVIGVEEWDNGRVEVQELDRGPDGEDFMVQYKFISISEPRILQQFSERRISSGFLRGDADFDVPFDIPTRNERLAGMGFVITLPDLPRSKRSLEDIITASGGVVYEKWESLVSLNGTVESHGRRMSGRTEKVRVRKEDVPGRLFCLTDEARSTPKFLIALALGVPCLSLKWVLERALKPDNERTLDWHAYVLPAGYNVTTRMPASQAFDRAWWRKSQDASTLISNPPVFKPFHGKSFLCFGTREFLFTQDELGVFPKLLLAMGASYVEAVTEVAYINKPPAQFDYTVVDDGEAHLEHRSARAVDVSWIKKCLIAGVEGPVPWPDSS